MKKLFTLLLFVFIGQNTLSSQCTPAAALTCEEAGLLCGLDELDGYSCTTLSTSNPTGPDPLCGGSGVPNNTQWWSFYGDYKNITITFNTDYSNCSLGKGIEAGVLRGCDGQTIACNTDCNSEVFSFTFWAFRCEKYFLWIDGCDGDICDFDIQVENGAGPQAFSYKPRVSGPVQCLGTEVQLCVEYDNSPCDYPTKWILRGQDVPNSNGKVCITTDIPLDSGPFEVCAEFQVGDGSVLCDQKVNCFVVIPDPIESIYEGEKFVCWEEHGGNGYSWLDSIIYSNCVDPPCKIIKQSNNLCLVEYTAEIHLFQQREIKEVYRFVCDKSELPYHTEDGSIWFEELCAEEITWSDQQYYDCDTAYILYLEVFNPEISITTSCPNCDDKVTIYGNIEYEPECSIGQTSWIKYWTNEVGDTIGVGDSLIPEEDGRYFLLLHVNHVNNFTGELQSCTLLDTSWYAIVKHDPLSISGDSLICQKDTSEFFLPDVYSNGCEILWTIEDLDGQIITLEPEKKSKIEVYWPTDNTTDGKICAEIIDACDSVRKVCRTLEGCVTTQNNNANTTPWKVFPNPARDVIYIEGDLNELDIQMHDLHGNTISIQPKQDISGAISIDVERLSAGVYFILLLDGEKSGVFKLLIL